MSEPGAIEVKLHGTTDARVWAQEFIEVARREIRCPDCAVSGEIDEGWMIGWFANAIETGRAAGLLADMDLAQVVAELRDIYRGAVTEPETGNAWRDGYVTGYVRAMRTALTIASGTPPETPTTPGERADRRTT